MSLPNSIRPAREAALVTGAGNGIGHAIAQAFVGEACEAVKLQRTKKKPPY